MLLSEVQHSLMELLLPLYGQRESSLMTEMVIEDLTGWDRTLCRSMQHHAFPEATMTALASYMEQLARAVPIQYVLGHAWFYDMQLKVNSHVLIPRPETEELVDRIVKAVRFSHRTQRILDLGTGSGCIPLGIKKGLPHCEVKGCDISEAALKVARQNAEIQKLDVDFFLYDILSERHLPVDGCFDIIVSNPPYIPFSERNTLHRNVTEHEPSLALFVEDDDPLIFYRKIATLGLNCLSNEGNLYFEIHESMSLSIQNLLNDLGYENVKVFKDLQGKDRMVHAVKA